MAAVAYETGFFGESAARYFPDTALFGELWARAYFLEELNGPLGFAAEAGGQFLGYIIGTADMDAYRRRFVQVLGRVAWGALRGAYPQLVGCLPYLTRAARYPGPHAPEEAYPAHLHLNLRPEARGLGLGGRCWTRTSKRCASGERRGCNCPPRRRIRRPSPCMSGGACGCGQRGRRRSGGPGWGGTRRTS